ncbi:MAG: helix-turn-helix transcriptional regulator [Oscillospiraceae bacterium]
MHIFCVKRQWLYELRIRHNLTQTQMAQIIGADPSHYTRLESGKRDTRNGLRLIYLSSLAKHFGISIENLCNAEIGYLESVKARM